MRKVEDAPFTGKQEAAIVRGAKQPALVGTEPCRRYAAPQANYGFSSFCAVVLSASGRMTAVGLSGSEAGPLEAADCRIGKVLMTGTEIRSIFDAPPDVAVEPRLDAEAEANCAARRVVPPRGS